jgi:hypothetical protein
MVSPNPYTTKNPANSQNGRDRGLASGRPGLGPARYPARQQEAGAG